MSKPNTQATDNPPDQLAVYQLGELSVYQPDEPSIYQCAQQLKEGQLVIFPTETVYGLGANANDPAAIEKIYRYKQRPKNNPLILHVRNWETASLATRLSDLETQLVEILTQGFWPGPLTLLLRKSQYVSDSVTAGSDWVGLRCPQHPVAQKLLEVSNLAIVAPSANLSGQISSTQESHLLQYFSDAKLSILAERTPSPLGVESTIIKIDGSQLTLVRPGTITIAELENHLRQHDLDQFQIQPMPSYQQMDHPGSSLQHYAPKLPTFLFRFPDPSALNQDAQLSDSACLDFRGHHYQLRHLFNCYLDLSPEGDLREALSVLYRALHRLNNSPGFSQILIYNDYQDKPGLSETMYDRVYRAANGKCLTSPEELRYLGGK